MLGDLDRRIDEIEHRIADFEERLAASLRLWEAEPSSVKSAADVGNGWSISDGLVARLGFDDNLRETVRDRDSEPVGAKPVFFTGSGGNGGAVRR